ncbi:ABC transporter permease [Ligaoa zhengdingensis]|uniref:ABC transporter permease n=2 Tax=Ligaoa zhengdingensis TaxID=2763658 RepID=UPI0031B9F3F1
MQMLSAIGGAMWGAVAQGILWGIMALGVYITFKVLDFADLTVDGSFATGGAVSAILISLKVDPFLTLLVSLAAGMLTGIITGLLHTKFKIPAILAGILTQIALYSINIRIMGDKPNIPLLGSTTIFSQLQKVFPGLSYDTITILLGLALSAVIIAALYWFFGTEVGCCIRATGNNEYMVRALGGNTNSMKVLGLMLSNGLVALSGALVAQQQGYALVDMGTGAIVIGLASVIIGEVVFGKRFNFAYCLASVVIGSVLYRVVIAIVLQLGMKATDQKMITAILVALALALPVIRKWLFLNGKKKQPAPRAAQ